MDGKKYNFTPQKAVVQEEAPVKKRWGLFGGAKKKNSVPHAKGRRQQAQKNDPDKKIRVSKLKRESVLKFMRLVMWGFLVFVAIRGATALAKPDPVNAMRSETQSFMKSFSAERSLQLEVSSFAQNFVKEYLTYAAGDEVDYAGRIQMYGPKIFSTPPTQLKASSSCSYSSAYKIELYDQNQYDVHVMAKVEYQTPQVAPDGSTITVSTSMENVYFKVPVRWSASGCVVTDFPAFVAGPGAISYPNQAFNGDMLDDDKTEAIEKAMTDFFTVYYGDSQSRVDYYLQTPALGSKIKAMYGRYTFEKIDTLEAFKDPNVEGDFVAITKIKVIDVNGVNFDQRYSIYLTHKDGRYYIKALDNRAVDLKITKKEEH